MGVYFITYVNDMTNSLYLYPVNKCTTTKAMALVTLVTLYTVNSRRYLLITKLNATELTQFLIPLLLRLLGGGAAGSGGGLRLERHGGHARRWTDGRPRKDRFLRPRD